MASSVVARLLYHVVTREMEPLPPRDIVMVINKEHDMDDNNKKGIKLLY